MNNLFLINSNSIESLEIEKYFGQVDVLKNEIEDVIVKDNDYEKHLTSDKNSYESNTDNAEVKQMFADLLKDADEYNNEDSEDEEEVKEQEDEEVTEVGDEQEDEEVTEVGDEKKMKKLLK